MKDKLITGAGLCIMAAITYIALKHFDYWIAEKQAEKYQRKWQKRREEMKMSNDLAAETKPTIVTE